MENPSGIKPLKQAKLSQGVFVQLCDLIRVGHFQGGQRLPSEKELCELFRVSRTTVRSGLQSLNALGLVESRDGSGTYVTESTPESVGETLGVVLFHGVDDVEQIYEGRRVIESWTAYLAATRITTDEIECLEELVNQQSEEVRQGRSGIETDFQFHFQIGKAARNEVVLRILRSMITLIFKALDPSKRNVNDFTLAVEQHRRILDSIRVRDPYASMCRMYEHISNSSAISFPSEIPEAAKLHSPVT